jgi:hypothetical protein
VATNSGTTHSPWNKSACQETGPFPCAGPKWTFDVDDPHGNEGIDTLFHPRFTESWDDSHSSMSEDRMTGQLDPMAGSSRASLDEFSAQGGLHVHGLVSCVKNVNAEDFPADGEIYELSNQLVGSPAARWTSNTIPLTIDLLDSNTKQGLTLHYFNTVCQILSCFDSYENPFCSDIPRVMLTCGYIHDCVIGMSAAHLANTSVEMESISLSHQTQAMAGLSMALTTISTPDIIDNSQNMRRDPSAQSSRYQALLAAMLLNISSVSTKAFQLHHINGLIR